MDLATYASDAGLNAPQLRAKLALQGVKVSTEIVRRWMKGMQPVGVKSVPALESVTEGKVTRYDLRPDVFGDRPQQGEAA